MILITKPLIEIFNADSGFRWNNNNIELLVEPIDDYVQHKIIDEARNKILGVLHHSSFIIVDRFYPNDLYISSPIFTPYKLKLGLSKNGKLITKTVTFNIIVETTLFDIKNEIEQFIHSYDFLLLFRRPNLALDFIKDMIYEFLETKLHINRSYLKDRVGIKLEIVEARPWEWVNKKIKIVCDFITKTRQKITKIICRNLN